MEILPRSAWGARPPRSRATIPTPTPRVWLHHSADSRQGAAAVRAHQAFHMDSHGWQDAGYSFFVDNATGLIWEGRGAGVQGGHTAGQNSSSHGICLLGNFETMTPSAAAIESLVWLLAHGAARGWWLLNVGAHRDAPGASTLCNGNIFHRMTPAIARDARNYGGAPQMSDAQIERALERVLQRGVPADRQQSTRWWQLNRIGFGHTRAIRREIESGDAFHRWAMSERGQMALGWAAEKAVRNVQAERGEAS